MHGELEELGPHNWKREKKEGKKEGKKGEGALLLGYRSSLGKNNC